MRFHRGGRMIAAMNRCNPFTVKDDNSLTRRARLFTRLLVAGALCLGAAAPAGWAHQAPAPAQDLRSPDARDAARLSVSQVRPSSAARDAVRGQASQDLRSPDARDAALAATTFTRAPAAGWPMNPPAAQTSAPPATDPARIPWSEAGIALALVALAAATIGRRRRPVAR